MQNSVGSFLPVLPEIAAASPLRLVVQIPHHSLIERLVDGDPAKLRFYSESRVSVMNSG